MFFIPSLFPLSSLPFSLSLPLQVNSSVNLGWMWWADMLLIREVIKVYRNNWGSATTLSTNEETRSPTFKQTLLLIFPKRVRHVGREKVVNWQWFQGCPSVATLSLIWQPGHTSFHRVCPCPLTGASCEQALCHLFVLIWRAVTCLRVNRKLYSTFPVRFQ